MITLWGADSSGERATRLGRRSVLLGPSTANQVYNADVNTLRANPSTLLEIDAAANLALGALLLASSSRILRLVGLPSADPPFYSRVLGGVLSVEYVEKS